MGNTNTVEDKKVDVTDLSTLTDEELMIHLEDDIKCEYARIRKIFPNELTDSFCIPRRYIGEYVKRYTKEKCISLEKLKIIIDKFNRPYIVSLGGLYIHVNFINFPMKSEVMSDDQSTSSCQSKEAEVRQRR